MIDRYFSSIVRHPWVVLAVFALAVVGLGIQLPGIRFDNRPDAFIPPQHPSFISKRQIERDFGLEDPMLVAVDTGREDGVFEERPLELIVELSRAIEEHLRTAYPGESLEHPVYSLATEWNVRGVEGGIPVEEPFLDPFPRSPEALLRVKEDVARLELYDGVIVGERGRAGAIVVVPPSGKAQEVNRFLSDLIARKQEDLSRLPGETIRLAVAGEAAVRSSMGDAVARDALLLNPICAAVVALFLYAAFPSLAGVLLPLSVVASGSVIMLGLMALLDKPVYIITNAILVTVLSLGVADAIHVQGQYYEELRAGGFRDRQDLVIRALRKLWVPILITSVTDMAGFLSFLFTGVMPPLEWFGLFTAVGVGATLISSLSLLPAGLLFLDPDSPRQRRHRNWAAAGRVAFWLARGGAALRRSPRRVVAVSALILAVALAGALRMRVDQSMVSAFDEDSEIVQADRIVNSLFDGTYFLDVLIEANEPGGLLEPEVLRKVADLESHARTLPHVKGSVSYVGFARKMNHIMNDWDDAKNVLPADAQTVKDHFSLIRDHSPSKKADLARVIDKEGRTANVRVRLNTGWYSEEREVVEAMQAYLTTHFPPDGTLRASLSGRVNMDYHWVNLIVRSQALSVGCTVVLVFTCLLVQFRFSVGAAAFCLLPVGAAILATYAVMGAAGIELSISTSMFASLATGVGVNFPIHVLHRLHLALREERKSEDVAYGELFSVTGKSLVFNGMAVCFGFLALLLSELPLLRHFGLLIALGIGTACVASLTLLPALLVWGRPRFIYGEAPPIEAPPSVAPGADA